jgi:hypothetical protein
LPDHTIIRRPDCAFLLIEQTVFREMNIHLKLEERLLILRAEDQFRRWNSLDDERFCILCERKFSGRQIEIRCLASGKYELRCPTEGCNSRLQQWVCPETPLVSDIVDPDWWRAKKKRKRPFSGAMGFQG